MPSNTPPPVYLFFDESGNLHFGPEGSPFYFFGALTTTDPFPLSRALVELRYSLMEDGSDLERFHASEDRQVIRDRVLATLASCGGFEFDAVIVEKRKTHPALHAEARFYPKFAGYLLRFVFKRYPDSRQRVIVVTDRLPVRRHRDAVEKAFKLVIREQLGARPFSIMHHASSAHPCLQAADYCTWAVHKKWVYGELRPLAAIAPFVRSEFDIFSSGTEFHY